MNYYCYLWEIGIFLKAKCRVHNVCCFTPLGLRVLLRAMCVWSFCALSVPQGFIFVLRFFLLQSKDMCYRQISTTMSVGCKWVCGCALWYTDILYKVYPALYLLSSGILGSLWPRRISGVKNRWMDRKLKQELKKSFFNLLIFSSFSFKVCTILKNPF